MACPSHNTGADGKFQGVRLRAALHGCDGPGLAGSESEASPAGP